MGTLRAVVAADEVSDRALRMTGSAIGTNPTFYTAWQHRRRCLLATGADLTAELALTTKWGGPNPKNFQLWQHRRALCAEIGPSAAAGELALTAEVFEADAKNYHAWSHRRWVLQSLVLDAEGKDWAQTAKEELEWVDGLLESDVRNNSAWTHRWFVRDVGSAAAAGAGAGLPAHSAVAYATEDETAVREEAAWALGWVRRSGVTANESAMNHLRALGAAARSRERHDRPSGSGYDSEAALAEVSAWVSELAAGAGAMTPFVASFAAAFAADWREDEAFHAAAAGGEAAGRATEAALAALDTAAESDPARAAVWRARAASLRRVAAP